ncbi:hypothetical protein [Actinotalea ferrariae]|nr:hypothetical protein [Actinotalea ferrariae]
MSAATHREYAGEGYYVTVQHCEADGCDEYLGINYPGHYCDEHEVTP